MITWTKIQRRDENRSWSVVGDWEEDPSYLVIEMQKSRLKRLMLKSTYERPECYPYTLPVYRMPGEMKWD